MELNKNNKSNNIKNKKVEYNSKTCISPIKQYCVSDIHLVVAFSLGISETNK